MKTKQPTASQLRGDEQADYISTLFPSIILDGCIDGQYAPDVALIFQEKGTMSLP